MKIAVESELLLIFLVYMQKNHYFEGTDLVRFAHSPTSKLRSQNADHTPVRSQYFQNAGCALA
jgi:hypothetical protein